MPKISLWVEDTIAAVAFLAFALFAATSVLSIERNSPNAAPQAPAVTGNGSPSSTSSTTSQPAALLSHPLPYRAVVCQSDYGQKPKCVYYVERSQ